MTRTAKRETEVDEPAKVSSVPVSQPTSVSVLSAKDVSAEWLDRLFVATCSLPIADGESEVVGALVRALGEILPSFGIGACLVPAPVPSGSSPDFTGAAPPEQKVWKYLPPGEEHRGQGMAPTLLFPGFAYERIVEVESSGTTLHVACDDPRIEEDDAPVLHVMRRAALALGCGLRLARAHAKATMDARDLRVLNSHMVQAEKLASLGQIAAGVVHELNNPLTSIVAYTDWLIRKAGPDGDADSLERLRRIVESSRRILRFTRDLVAYARPSSEIPTPVSLHHVIDQALAFCEHVLAEHGVSVTRAFHADLPAVRGMHEQLVQVFVNLVTNACHAMPKEGGLLAVTTSIDAASRVVVVVEDNGHGIASDHLVAIFTPFFTTKVDGRGTGLGLSIVKNIVDNHGAEIRAERRDEGGARFVLMFPTS